MTTILAPAVRGLAEVAATDAPEVGGKAANLGELVAAGLPVPPGFVLPAASYLDAMDRAGVREELASLHARAIAAADDPPELDALCQRAAATVRRAGLPAGLVEQVRVAYSALPDGGGGATVAVRSSAVGEDGADASFAGMNATFTNVRGMDALLARIRECWASVFGARVVAYRAARGYAGEPAIAVVVQLMVRADRAGVVFTADPATGRRDVVVVEAAFGQGEVVVSGAVEPDTYRVGAAGTRLLAARVGHQTHEIVRGEDVGDRTLPLDAQRADARVLSDDEACDVARLALRVQQHFGLPQDVE